MTPKPQAAFQRRTTRRLLAKTAGLLLCLTAPTAALGVEARLDATSIHLGDSVRLVLEMEGASSETPDLRVLQQHFRILGRQARSSVSVVNGVTSERRQLVLTLTPLRAGLLEVPPIRVGDAATEPMRLAVGDGPKEYPVQPTPINTPRASPYEIQTQPVAQASDQDEAIRVEASTQPARVKVGQQTILVVRVLTPSRVTRPRLHNPSIDGARLLPLGEDRSQGRRGDTSYSVYERRYALFPERSGHLVIEPMVFQGWLRDSSGAVYPPQRRPVRATSESVALNVLPAPQDGSAAPWLPARDLSLTEPGPETYRVRTGQPLQRIIDVRADGLMAEDLPALDVPTPHEIDHRRGQPRLWNKREPTGVIGTRREISFLSADEPGRFRLPALTIEWWDTDTGRRERARLPARELIVMPAVTDSQGTTEYIDPGYKPATTDQGASPETVRVPGETHQDTSGGRRADTTGAGFWIWATGALTITWLATMAAWVWRRRRATTPTVTRVFHERTRADEPRPQPEPADPVGEAIDEVRCAYESGEAGAAREALLTWAALVLPERQPGNLALLANRCSEPLRAEILLLEQAFFSPRPVHWERRRVWERLPHFEPIPERQPASFRRKKPLRKRTKAGDES